MSSRQYRREARAPDELFVYQKATLADVLARVKRIQLELSEFSRGEEPAQAAPEGQEETTSLVFGTRSDGGLMPVETVSRMTRFLSAEAEYKARLMTIMRQAAADFGWDNTETVLAMHLLKLKLNASTTRTARLLGIVRTPGQRGCVELMEILNVTMVNDDPALIQLDKWRAVQRYLNSRYRMRVPDHFVSQWMSCYSRFLVRNRAFRQLRLQSETKE